LLLLSLLCTIFAGWNFRQNFFGITSLYLWLVALCLVLGAGFVHDRRRAANDPPMSASMTIGDAQAKWTRVDWILVVLLGVVALGLRLYQIGPLLPPVHGDEGEMGMLALLALHGPASGLSAHRLPFFSTAFLDHPTLFHYLQAFGLWLFGESITSLRVLSAIFGALCAPFLYAIGRVGWGRVAGFTAGWLLAVSHLHIQYSRIALNNIENVLLVIVLIWLLALAYEANAARRGCAALDVNPDADVDADVDSDVDLADTKQTPPLVQKEPALLLFIVIGLTIGLAQYFYYGSRLMPVLAGVSLIVLWRKQRVTVQQIAVLIAATAVAYFPLAFFYTNDLRAFLNRMKGVNIFTPEGLAHTLGSQAVWPNDIPLLLWTQLKFNLYFFLHYGDRSAFYLADIPAFDPITVELFWLGLGLTLARVRRYHEFALLTWLGLGVFLAGVVTNDAPNGPRLIVAVPAMYMIAGLFLQRGYDFFTQVWGARSRWVAGVVVSSVAVTTLYLNFNTYFVEYKAIQPNVVPVYLALEMADHAAEDRAYLLGAPHLYVNYGTLRFLAVAAEKYDLESPEQFMEMVAKQQKNSLAPKGALIIALPQHAEDLAQIEARFPNGTRTERKDPRGNLYYVTYEIPSTELIK
jgi:4-amino-4-deoxy-L-arabinose transferase-like glycosyltransferase